MKHLIELLRPLQWLKNLFIFLPLFFDRHLFDLDYLIPCVLMFIAYCFAASGIYCFNDINDVEADKKHPKKSKRPIASGVVSIRQGYVLMFVCFLLSFMILTLMNQMNMGNVIMFFIVGIYVILDLAYCVLLKQLAIVDVFVIAVGFVLRIFAGGVATGIHLTNWIVLMTFLLALFLAFAKRRDDVVLYEHNGVTMRKNVNCYSLAFMNEAIGIVASITMVCYIMYSVSTEVVERFSCSYVYLTSVFVLAAIIRYLQITIVDVKSGSPTTVLLKDHFIQGCILSWVIAFVVIIYMF